MGLYICAREAFSHIPLVIVLRKVLKSTRQSRAMNQTAYHLTLRVTAFTAYSILTFMCVHWNTDGFQVLIHTSVSVVITFNPQLVFAYLFTSTRRFIYLYSINCYSIAISTPGFLLDLRHTESESFVSPLLMIFSTFSQENLTLWFGCLLKRLPAKRNASLPPISFKPPRASSLQQGTTGMSFEPCSDKRIPLSPIGREEV